LIFPTPFISQDSRSIKALLLFLITGFFIITAINKAENYNLKFLLVISMLFMISIIYFKYGLSRSDSGHIRGATGFLYIPFFSFLFLKLIKLFPNKKINISKKINLIFNSLLIIIFFSTILINKKFERKSISNFISSKENILKLFRYSDESYISEDYQKLVSYYNDLSKPDSDFDLIGTLFYDYGKIRQYKDSSNITLTTPNEYSLSGWGVSFDLIANERVKLNLGWAQAIGDNDGKSSSGNNSDGRGGSSRAWFQVVFRF